MKRILTALSLAALALTAYAGTEVTTNPEFDRSLPTYPELAAAKYRFDAGESTQDAVVSDVG
jgi:hypothetical protein